jgi:hypothetical protein
VRRRGGRRRGKGESEEKEEGEGKRREGEEREKDEENKEREQGERRGRVLIMTQNFLAVHQQGYAEGPGGADYWSIGYLRL